MILDQLQVPIVLSPMAGGPSTPALAAAVSEAGGLGFLAAGYLDVGELETRIAETRRRTARPFGVNLFMSGTPSDPERYRAYAAAVAEESARAGVVPGEPVFSDDGWDAKLELLASSPVPVASFTFGCPADGTVTRFQKLGIEVWVTVTTLEEAIEAVSNGVDALVLQGAEAGGHRGSFTDDPADDVVDGLTLSVLLQLVLDTFDVPCVAAGGLMTGRAIASVLAGGALAAQLGTAFLLATEAGTSKIHREAVHWERPTSVTRAFTGRTARGIRNRFIDQHTASAPAAYPEIHFVSSPLRAAGRASGDGEVVNLWAGQTHLLAENLPAAEIVRKLEADRKIAVERLSRH